MVIGGIELLFSCLTGVRLRRSVAGESVLTGIVVPVVVKVNWFGSSLRGAALPLRSADVTRRFWQFA